MRAAGLRAKAVQGYRAKASIHQRYARHPNRVWSASVTKPNQVWVGDITYLKVGGTWRYLAIVMDQYSRRILAWTLTRQRTAGVTCAVLLRAVRGRSAGGVIFHSAGARSTWELRSVCKSRRSASFKVRVPGDQATMHTPNLSSTLSRPN